MTVVNVLKDVEFGVDLPAFEPDTTLETVKTFAKLIGWGGARFSDHEAGAAHLHCKSKRPAFPAARLPEIRDWYGCWQGR